MWLRRSFVALAIAVIGCKEKAPADAAPQAAAADSTQPVEVMAPDQSYSLRLPARWRGLIRTDTLSAAERGTARPAAVNVVYLPRDTAVIPQTLIVVTVYDSVAWLKVKAEGGPPPGDSISSHKGLVYVLSLPQSNPFAPGSVDALKFDSLNVRAEDKASLLKFPGN